MIFFRLRMSSWLRIHYLKNVQCAKKFSLNGKCLMSSKVQLEFYRTWDNENKSVGLTLSKLPYTEWTEIFECKSSKELLSLASRKCMDWKFDPNEYVYLFNHLEDVIYNEELMNIPSLCKLKARRAYVYALLYFHSDMRERIYSLIKSPELDQLLCSLEEDINRLDVECLPYLLTSLVYLGIPTSNTAIKKGVFKLLEKPEFSWVDLLLLGRIDMGNRRLFLTKYVIPKFNLLLNSSSERSREMLFCLVSFLDFSCYSSLNQSYVTKSLRTIASFSDEEMFKDTAIAFKTVEMINHLLNDQNRMHLLDENYPLLRKISLSAIECLLQHADQIPVQFYNSIMGYTRTIFYRLFLYYYTSSMRCYFDLHETLMNLSQSLITQGDINIMDFVNNFPFTRISCPSYMKQVEGNFLSWIRNNDLDASTVVEFANAYRCCKNSNIVVINEIKRLLVAKIKQIKDKDKLQEATAFFNDYSQPVNTFSLSDKPESCSREDPYRDRFRSYLIDILDTQVVTVKQTCIVASDIILLSRGMGVPQVVVDRLMDAVPIAKSTHLDKLVVVLLPEIVRGNVPPAFKTVWDVVLKTLNQNKDKKHFTSYAKAIGMFIENGGYASEEAFSEILDGIEFPDHMSIFDYEQFVKDLIRLRRYYNEKLLKKLENFVITNTKSLTVNHLSYLLKHMNQVDYEVQSSQFVDACEEILEADFDRVSLHVQLMLMKDMVNLQVMPEKFVTKIFSLEYFSKLDKALKDMTKKHQYVIKKQFQDLNRCLVMDYPELNIPWVMKSFIDQPYIKGNKREEHKRGCEEIENVLHELLGGHQYYRADVIAPYWYKTDFEVYLDKYGMPVPHHLVKPTNKDAFKRIAVMYLFKALHCMNDHRLTGSVRKRINHLEMMGYHVVQVPFYEWDSENLRTRESKLDYLRAKLDSS